MVLNSDTVRTTFCLINLPIFKKWGGIILHVLSLKNDWQVLRTEDRDFAVLPPTFPNKYINLGLPASGGSGQPHSLCFFIYLLKRWFGEKNNNPVP